MFIVNISEEPWAALLLINLMVKLLFYIIVIIEKLERKLERRIDNERFLETKALCQTY